jgi:photosystem II PsbX protein
MKKNLIPTNYNVKYQKIWYLFQVMLNKILFTVTKYEFLISIIMTSSLANFLGSLFWGSFIVIIPITIALIVVSRLDPLDREED